MTLLEITNKIKTYAGGQFSNPTVMVGSVYENMNTKELKYPCINIDNVNVIKSNYEMIYSFYIYYADRLSEDGSNTLQIQSEANTSLQLILHKIYDSGVGRMTLDELYSVVITPYTMKFADLCAGAWLQVNVHVPDGIDYCDDPSQIRTLYITANGDYDVEDYEAVNVNVIPEPPTATTSITVNGEYDVKDYGTAIVSIPFEDYYQSGYTSGYTDGVASVPLTSTGFTQNGVYLPSDGGWNSVTVNVPSVTTQSLTQQEYDALETKDPMVIYLIISE